MNEPDDEMMKTLKAVGDATFQHTTGQLRKNRSAGTCAALCRRIAEASDRKFKGLNDAGAGIACAAGCNFCCYLRVSIFPHEAIALFRELREKLPHEVAQQIEARILSNASEVDKMTVEQHFATNLKCAFLVDGLCSVHPVRPSACAGYHSMSKEQCEYSFNNPTDFGTPDSGKPTLLELQAFGEVQSGATQAGLEKAGLNNSMTELHQALRSLIADPAAADRWRNGEPLVSS